MRTLDTVTKHLRRTPYQAIAAVLTMFLTFLVTGVFFINSLASMEVLRHFESKPQITVFFGEKAGEKEVVELQRILEDSGKVVATKYVSKQEALAIYQEQNKNDPLLLEMVTADILPASLEVSAKDPAYLDELLPLMKAAAGVEEVVYQKDIVDALLSWTKAIRVVGGVLGGLLTFNSLLIMMTVIGMKIALRKEEIEILRLVGASPWYIRWPFVLEGGLYGVVGASAASVLILSLILWARPFLLTFLGIVPSIEMLLVNPLATPFILASLVYLIMLSTIGFLLGSLGSFIALARYLTS